MTLTRRQMQAQFGRRYRQLSELVSSKGVRGVVDRISAAASERLAPKDVPLPVRRQDVLSADLSCRPAWRITQLNSGDRMVINWVTIPAGPKSGGHTTMFRMMRYLEEHGYANRLYFYNVWGGDHQYYESVARDYYGFQGEVRTLDHRMQDAHAVVATSWPTAYPVFNDQCAGKRFYFVQDYEPSFYSVGALSLLAENTYKMGFHAITAGKWLAQKLTAEFEMAADSFDFGCDTSVYHRIAKTKRSGLVFYARPEAARRGFELGVMAMESFAARRPEIDLHFYGEAMGTLPFRFIDHGRVSPEELNRIYNQCYAGLSLSLTNVSLVPHEMLAAGCIPVVNDAVQNRIVLDNPYVRYSAPYPLALASELEALVTMPDFEIFSQAAAMSVHDATWDDAGATVDGIFRRALRVS